VRGSLNFDMQLHELKLKTKKKKGKRIGRGGKRGGYSGRGIKGQKSRAGHKIRPVIRDIIKKIPKKRGYKFKPPREKPQILNLAVLENKFKEDERITPVKLLQSGLITRKGKRKLLIKILGEGNLTKKFTFSGCEFSASAKEKILKTGGTII